jgi:ribulose-phosphate 3-epimerase
MTCAPLPLELSASLFAANPLEFGQTIQKCLQAGIHHLHLDIMDLHYVPNLALSFDTIHQITQQYSSCTLDVHLMVQDPIIAVDKLPPKGIRHVFFHPHTNPTTNLQIIKHIQKTEALAGCTLNPNECWSTISPLLTHVSCALIMGVIPGFSGQVFQATAYQHLQKIGNHPHIHWAVDGGVNPKTLPLIQNYAVNHCVLGSALVRGNIQKNYHSIQASLGVLPV